MNSAIAVGLSALPTVSNDSVLRCMHIAHKKAYVCNHLPHLQLDVYARCMTLVLASTPVLKQESAVLCYLDVLYMTMLLQKRHQGDKPRKRNYPFPYLRL